MKVLVFDMDGTIADLYNVDGWLQTLRAGDASPYREAKPMYDMMLLTDLLWLLKNDGWLIVVTTWLSKEATHEYDNKVRLEKRAWLDRYDFPYDELHMVKYGTTKANCTRHLGGFQILIDDNEKIRNGWTLGDTIDAKVNIFKELQKLVA